MDKEIEQLSTSVAASLTEKQAKRYLNYLRWPETDGKPVCPRCEEEKRIYNQSRPDFQCGACGKQFSWVTWQPFVHSKLPANKILALIVASRRGITGAHASRIIKIKDRTAVKWIKVINQEFLEDDYFLPPPDKIYEHRNSIEYAEQKPIATKKQIAQYLLDNRNISFNQFERDFGKYDLKEARAILNSIINYSKEKLRQISEGKDPLAEVQKEMERLRKKIDKKDIDVLDNMHIDPGENLGVISYKGGLNEKREYLGTEIFSFDNSDFDHLTHELRITKRDSDDY